MYALQDHYFAGIQYQFNHVFNIRYDSGSTFDRAAVVGKQGSITSGFGPVFLYDSRDNVINSRKGFYLDISGTFYERFMGGNYFFRNFMLDTRKFIRLHNNIILCMQGLVNFNWGHVPFRQLAQMGGDMIMRGYYLGTYRGKFMLCYQSEVRIPIWKFIGIVVFGGLGEVQHNFSDFNLTDIKYTYGAGLRFMLVKHERVNLGGDVGFSKNTQALYIGSGEAF